VVCAGSWETRIVGQKPIFCGHESAYDQTAGMHRTASNLEGTCSMYRLLILTVMIFMSASASAGDAWWKVCRPMADHVHPRHDPCACQKFRWAAQEVCRAPKPCIQKRCSWKEACCEYRTAWRSAMCAPKVCSHMKPTCHEGVAAYKCAAAELCRCRKCVRR
jgi:hypothetical protein